MNFESGKGTILETVKLGASVEREGYSRNNRGIRDEMRKVRVENSTSLCIYILASRLHKNKSSRERRCRTEGGGIEKYDLWRFLETVYVNVAVARGQN